MNRWRGARAIAFAAAATASLVLVTPVGRGLDVCTYFCAGLVAGAEGAPAAFDRDALDRKHAEYHPGRGKLGAFLYSPVYLLPARALAALPLARAEEVNQAAGMVALGIGLAALLLRIERWTIQVIAAAAFVVCHPVAVLFGFGNWTYFAFLWLALATTFSAARRPLLAAPFWALAIHLKLYFTLPLVALGLAGRRKEVRATVAWIAGWAVAFLPWTGLESYAAFARGIAAAARLGVLPTYNAVSIPSALARFVAPKMAWIASPEGVHGGLFVVVAAIGLAALAALLYALRHDAEHAVAATLLWILLFSPLAWDHLELLLFLLVPVLAAPAALALCVVLGATAWFGPFETRAVVAALAGLRSPLGVNVLLLFYPFVNLLALALVFASRRRATPSDAAPSDAAA